MYENYTETALTLTIIITYNYIYENYTQTVLTLTIIITYNDSIDKEPNIYIT